MATPEGDAAVDAAKTSIAALRALLARRRQPAPHRRIAPPHPPRERRRASEIKRKKMRRTKAQREAEEAKRRADEEATKRREDAQRRREELARAAARRRMPAVVPAESLVASRPGLMVRRYAGDKWLAAVCAGEELAVKRMIESGYDIHLRDRKGWNALLVATVNGRSEIVRMLLVHGAHMNSRCTVRYLERVCQPAGNTALMWAATYGLTTIAKMLIHEGAAVDRRNRSGQTALMLAAECDCDPIVHAILAVAMRNLLHVQDHEGLSALHYAARSGAKKPCERMVNEGALVNMKTQAGFTPLMLAAKLGHGEVLQVLVSGGSDVDACAECGSTALIEAVTAVSNCKEIIATLLDAGASPKAVRKDGYNAMVQAIAMHRLDAIAALADGGASVGALPGKGEVFRQTPLTFAVSLGMVDVVALLLELGAVDWAPDANGLTPLQVALAKGRSRIVDVLDPSGEERAKLKVEAAGTTSAGSRSEA